MQGVGLAISALFLLAGLPTPVHSQETKDAIVHLAPKDNGPRRFSVVAPEGVTLHRGPSSTSETNQTVSDGSILLNRGCAKRKDTVWCKVRPLKRGAPGFAPSAFLVPSVGPDGTIPTGVDDSRQRAKKRDFDARATIPCAQEVGQALGKCEAKVARGTGGDASIAVTFPNGFTRTLYFVHGEFMSASATMSGVGTDNEWALKGNIHVVRVDDQRYELPDQFVFGD